MRKNVTFIDDLFDAESLMPEKSDYISKGNLERDEYASQIKNRHVRKHSDNTFALNGGSYPEMPKQDFQPFTQLQMYQEPMRMQPYQEPMRMQPYQEPMRMMSEEISCMTIATHIKDCPICSRFYNCDNSMYIVCIVLLIIVCVILLKRIIEK